ncbi:hypothetical protein FBT69_00465 [Synechococcales cyanobacterium CNB]|nr:hypothetical protein [Synechococcales cyanobacterium CNB]
MVLRRILRAKCAACCAALLDARRKVEVSIACLQVVPGRDQWGVTTNNEQQQIEIEVGPQPGEVRVYGIDGIPSGTLFTGVTAIDLTTGRAQDYVEFRVYATVIPGIRVDTGAGNSDVKFIYFLPFSVAPVVSDVEVVGNAANDFLKIVADQPGAMKPYLDGGPGYDEAIGFGTIVNVEKIN